MLAIYGPYIAKYSGKCELISKSGAHITGSFDVVQLHNGGIYMYVKITKKEQIKNWAKVQDFSSTNPSHRIIKMVGKIRDGRRIESQGDVFLVSADDYLPIGRNSTKLVFHLQSLEIGRRRLSTKTKLIRCHLTNLVFNGIEWHMERIDKKRYGYRKTRFNLKNTFLTIYPSLAYKNRVREMRATRLCRVTSFVDVKMGRKRKETILDLVNSFCLMLSFAKGTQINWVYYEEFGSTKKPIFVVHADRITRDYSSLDVIDDMPPKLLKTYIDDTKKSFLDLVEEYPLNKIIGTIIVAKLNGSFIELRALLLTGLVDVLTGLWAKTNRRVSIIDETKFDTHLIQITDSVIKLLTGLGIAKEKAKNMAAHIPGFNYFSFGSNLRRIVKSYDANITSSEITNFIKSRNNLVHRGEFVSVDRQEQTREFLRIVSFVDRLLLGLFGYKGSFTDLRSLLP